MWFKRFPYLIRAYFVLFFSIGLTYGQEAKSILIFPYSALNFQVEFNSAELDSINGIGNEKDVFSRYQDTMLKYLSTPYKEINGFVVPENEMDAINNRLLARYQGKPTGHIGVDLSPILQSGEFQRLVKGLDVDYVLFLTRYSIRNKLLTANRSFDGSYLLPWSTHELDYELYDKEGKLVALADRFEMNTPVPNNENYKFKGLLLKQLKPGYRSILKDIHLKLIEFEKKGKPIYKLKK